MKLFIPPPNSKNKNHNRLMSIINNLGFETITDLKRANEAQFIVFPEMVWNIFQKGMFKDTLSNVYKHIKNNNILPQNKDITTFVVSHILSEYFKKLEHDLNLKNKKRLVFIILDNTTPFSDLKNTLIFRTSLFKSKQLTYEQVMPIIWKKKLSGVCYEPLPKTQKPKVGFCGCLHTNPYRKKVCDSIDPQLIEKNYILREKFQGSEIKDKTQRKEDFYNNIKETHFTLCPRGAGNFSIRFYQTLSCGRIPVLLDTDSVLPFENEIDWNNLIVRIYDMNTINRKIIEYYEKNDIVKKQEECYRIFQEYFTETSYPKKIASILSGFCSKSLTAS